MRMRMGFIIGLGAGYVLGTKAGRERFEQIRGFAGTIMDSERAQDLKQRAAEAVDQAKQVVQDTFGSQDASDVQTIRLDGGEQTPAPAQEPFSPAGLREVP